MKIFALTLAIVTSSTNSVISVAGESGMQHDCRKYMKETYGYEAPNGYEEAYVHQGCSGGWFNDPHNQHDYRPVYRTQQDCDDNYNGCTYGAAWYCDDDQDVANLDVDNACIIKGCCYGKDPSDGDINQCVIYDDNGVWVCDEHAQEGFVEKAMLRGEITKDE